MPTLSFSAILSTDMDSEMEDVSPLSSDPPMIEIPLNFDFDFDLEDFNTNASGLTGSDTSSNGHEPRSPRTPTYTGIRSGSSDSTSPFNPDRFFKFPILADTPEPSPLKILSSSPAAQSHFDLHRVHSHSADYPRSDPPSSPASPLLWIWTCHLCRSKYPLGATRRCLIDGHYYCSGDSSAIGQKNVKRKKRGQSCSSEFDYVGWQEWSSWRRQVVSRKMKNATGVGQVKGTSCLKGCENCEYPSQCRYERMNKVPEVVATLSSKVVDRGTEIETAGLRSAKAEVKSKDAKAKKILKVDTGLTKSDARRKRTDSAKADKTIDSGEISPDLVNFASLMDPAMQGLDSQPGGDIGTMGINALQHTPDVESPSNRTSKSTHKENTKKKRSAGKCSTTQSRIGDFFGMAR